MFVFYVLKSQYEDFVLHTDDFKVTIAFYFIKKLGNYCEMFHGLKISFLLALGYVIINDVSILFIKYSKICVCVHISKGFKYLTGSLRATEE